MSEQDKAILPAEWLEPGAVLPVDFDTVMTLLSAVKALSAPVTPAAEQQEPQGEAAPANSLPTWSECNLIIENHEFRQRAALGLEGQVLDLPPTTPEPTALHRFIYEYDDADQYRSAWFLHRLECVLAEAATPPAQDARELPPLPEPEHDYITKPGFTENQMRAYARSALSQQDSADDQDRLFVLLCDIRAACGDNGRRMQPELVEYIREIAEDAARYRGMQDSGDAWQPIETAPKDSDILLYCKGFGVVRGHWQEDKYSSRPRPFWTNDRETIWGKLRTREDQPTHWMPLPAFPVDRQPSDSKEA